MYHLHLAVIYDEVFWLAVIDDDLTTAKVVIACMGCLDFCNTEFIPEEETTPCKTQEKEGRKCQPKNLMNAGWFSDKNFNKLFDPHAVSQNLTSPMAKVKPSGTPFKGPCPYFPLIKHPPLSPHPRP